ncbi:MAG: glycine cleavage T C-terminal barrel domain-containing protein, partial [Pseudomonadota bacterium]
GRYGHTVDKSLAMALIEPDLATAGTALSTHVVGVERASTVIPASPYDPEGRVMRA